MEKSNDAALCKEIHINHYGKTRRHSIVVETIGSLSPKKQKINNQRRKTTSNEEQLDKTLTPPKVIKSKRKKKSEESPIACPLGPKDLLITNENLQASTSYENNLDTALTNESSIFLDSNANLEEHFAALRADNNNISENIIVTAGRTRRQRRLSGLFPRILNTAFILDSGGEEKENSRTIVADTSIPNPLVDDNDPLSTSTQELITKTKLRVRKTNEKKLTEEEIIKYYTDRDVKIKTNTLETIYEVANTRKMSARKFKRFINFDDRMSSVKIKKRHSRVVKYQLWENVNPVNMDDFLNKMAEIEEDL